MKDKWLHDALLSDEERAKLSDEDRASYDEFARRLPWEDLYENGDWMFPIHRIKDGGFTENHVALATSVAILRNLTEINRKLDALVKLNNGDSQ